MADDDVFTIEVLKAAVKALKETDTYSHQYDAFRYATTEISTFWPTTILTQAQSDRQDRRLFKSFGKRKPHVRNAHPWWGYPVDDPNTT